MRISSLAGLADVRLTNDRSPYPPLGNERKEGSGKASPSWTVETISDWGLYPQLEEVWKGVQDRSSNGHLFTSYDWMKTWFGIFGQSKGLQIITLRWNGEWVGIAPLVISRIHRGPRLSIVHDIQPEDRRFLKFHRRGQIIPIRQLTVPANLQSGNVRGGLVTVAGHEEVAPRLFFEYLKGQRTWDLFCLPSVLHEESQRWHRAATETGLLVLIRPNIRSLYGLGVQPWETYYTACSRHFRKRFKAAQHRLESLGQSRIETVTDGRRIPSLIEEMFLLSKESWKESGDKDLSVHLPVTPQATQFYRELAERYALRGRCQLITFRLDHGLVAVLMAVTEGDTQYLLQTFYSPRVAPVSPGRFLMRELIEWAAGHGVRRIDMNGNSNIVRMFAKEVQTYDQIYVFRPEGYSRWLYQMVRASEKIDGYLRRLKYPMGKASQESPLREPTPISEE